MEGADQVRNALPHVVSSPLVIPLSLPFSDFCVCVRVSLPSSLSAPLLSILVSLHPPFLLSGCPPPLLSCSAARHRFCVVIAAAASGSKDPNAAAIAAQLLFQLLGPGELLCPSPGTPARLAPALGCVLGLLSLGPALTATA